MPPFAPKSYEAPDADAAPAFAKKTPKKRFGKKNQRKAAPIQRSLMQGRSPSGRR